MSKSSKIVDMTPDQIRAAIVIHSGKKAQAKIAKEQEVSGSAIYRTIEGLLPSHELRVAVAEWAGLDIARIWPSIYIYGGGPRKPGRPRNKQ
jgi:lambda repressor-like predicted transcriptional regulator